MDYSNKKVRLIELFAGIGSQAMALRDIDADFEIYRTIEFNKFAVKSYNAIHKTNVVPTDIRDVKGSDLGIVEKDKYVYLMTYSFPCQDISVAGLRKGFTKGTGTRSGLLWEVERLLNETEELPDILLMENVTNIHSKKNLPDFELWIDFLESKGYESVWQDLNAKDYGIPQSRNRTFMVSVLGHNDYVFPEPVPLNLTMNDLLEEDVGERYFINNERAEYIINSLKEKGRLDNMDGQMSIDLSVNNPDVTENANCVRARCGNGISNFKKGNNGVIVKDYSSGKPSIQAADLCCSLVAHMQKGMGKYSEGAVIVCR